MTSNILFAIYLWWTADDFLSGMTLWTVTQGLCARVFISHRCTCKRNCRATWLNSVFNIVRNCQPVFQRLRALTPHKEFMQLQLIPSFRRDLLTFIFRERGREAERGRETSMCGRNINRLPLGCPPLGTWPTTQARAPMGNRTCDPSVHGTTPNQLSHSSQGWRLELLRNTGVLQTIMWNFLSPSMLLQWSPP